MGTIYLNYFLEILKSPLWLGHCPEEFVMLAGARWLKHNGSLSKNYFLKSFPGQFNTI